MCEVAVRREFEATASQREDGRVDGVEVIAGFGQVLDDARLEGLRASEENFPLVGEVAAAIYRDFLPDALAKGRYVAAPEPSVVGHGVQEFQRARDIQLKGVSAAKVVVTLP